MGSGIEAEVAAKRLQRLQRLGQERVAEGLEDGCGPSRYRVRIQEALSETGQLDSPQASPQPSPEPDVTADSKRGAFGHGSSPDQARTPESLSSTSAGGSTQP